MATAWDQRRPPDPDLIADCVHCGFCLPTCPSYAIFEEEMDSPRGRIVLMRVGNEPGSEASEEMRVHLDRCLGCMACVTACPSGVQYDKLIEQARPQIERNAAAAAPRAPVPAGDLRAVHAPRPATALAPLLWVQQRLGVNDALAQRLGRVPALQAMLRLAPPVTRRAAVTRLPEVTPARGAARGRVALMQGCVQRVFFGDVNAATVRVLSAEGCDVHAPRQPRCCGALQLHAGVEEEALGLARADDRRLRGLRRGRGQRRRLRIGDEGLRAPALRRPGVGGARRRVLRQGPRRHTSCSPSTSPWRRATRCRCGSPTTTPATSPTRRRCAPSRARCCAASRSSSCSSPPTGRSAAARPASTTSCSRRPPPSSAPARPPTCSPPAPTPSRPATPAARCRSARTSTGTSCPIFHPMTLLDHSIRGTRP